MTPTHIAEELTKVLEEMPESSVSASAEMTFSASSQTVIYDMNDGTAAPPPPPPTLPTPPLPEQATLSPRVDQQGKHHAPPAQQLDVLRECAEACKRESEVKGRKFMKNELSMEEDPFRFYDASWKAINTQFNVEFRPPAHRRASLPSIPEEVEPTPHRRAASEPPEPEVAEHAHAELAELAESDHLLKPISPAIAGPHTAHAAGENPLYDVTESSNPVTLTNMSHSNDQLYQSGFETAPPPNKGRRRSPESKNLSLSLSPSSQRILYSKSTSFHRESPPSSFAKSPAYTIATTEPLHHEPSPPQELRAYLLDPFTETNSPKTRRSSVRISRHSPPSVLTGNSNSNSNSRNNSPNPNQPLLDSCDDETEALDSSKSLRLCFSPPSTSRYTSPTALSPSSSSRSHPLSPLSRTSPFSPSTPISAGNPTC